MAEAHEAVAYSFSVNPKESGSDVPFDHSKELYYSCLYACRFYYHRTLGFLYNSLYPGHPVDGLIYCGAVSASYLKGYDSSFGLISWLEKNILQRYLQSKTAKVLASIAFAAGSYIVIVQVRRCALKALFSYQGWMYQKHGEPIGLVPKVWMGLVRLFMGRKPSLYSCQSILPTLPLPSLDDTIKRYLRTVRPIYNDDEYENIVQLADEFKKTIGRKLQRYVWLKWCLSPNYVTDWWDKYVYLRGRSAIMVKSNFYCLDGVFERPRMTQTARAANIVHAAFKYRTELEYQEMKPLLIQYAIPLCSNQYKRQFNTVRIPGKENDELVHYDDSQHIAVYHKGRWFKVYVYHKAQLLLPCELQMVFDEIIRDETPPDNGEEQLAALTAGDRTHWAIAREKLLLSSRNRSSLEAIEQAAFVLVLDDQDFGIGRHTSPELDEYASAIFHGKGYDRWFDKSFNIIISRNAVYGCNVEHSWADAPISGHMTEYVLSEDIIVLQYDLNGNTRGTPRFIVPKPIKLRWTISDECRQMIEHSVEQAQALYNDVDLHVYVQESYSKNFMKKCKISPDAYIQMALQLAHYRDSGRFKLTYEASMTRLYRNGRTETVRACTNESSDWVIAMENRHTSNAERIRLLRLACDYHQQQYRDAMSGKGVDRHLFSLYIISKYLNVDSPFLQKVILEPWTLSTSQTPSFYENRHRKSNTIDSGVSAGGGFGPVADDGYGVSYIIAEDIIFFHISSRRSSPTTDSQRFGQQISRAMIDIQNLFEFETKSIHKS